MPNIFDRSNVNASCDNEGDFKPIPIGSANASAQTAGVQPQIHPQKCFCKHALKYMWSCFEGWPGLEL